MNNMIITFGKHKNKNIKDIFLTDHKHFMWLCLNGNKQQKGLSEICKNYLKDYMTKKENDHIEYEKLVVVYDLFKNEYKTKKKIEVKSFDIF